MRDEGLSFFPLSPASLLLHGWVCGWVVWEMRGERLSYLPLSRGDRFFGDPDAHQKLHKQLYEDHDDHMRKLCAFPA
jgi:hypothetical protein